MTLYLKYTHNLSDEDVVEGWVENSYWQYFEINLKQLLTPKQLEILKWIKQGKTSWDISMILNISERTFDFHATSLQNRLDATNRTQGVAIACSIGIIDL